MFVVKLKVKGVCRGRCRVVLVGARQSSASADRKVAGWDAGMQLAEERSPWMLRCTGIASHVVWLCVRPLARGWLGTCRGYDDTFYSEDKEGPLRRIDLNLFWVVTSIGYLNLYITKAHPHVRTYGINQPLPPLCRPQERGMIVQPARASNPLLSHARHAAQIHVIKSTTVP